VGKIVPGSISTGPRCTSCGANNGLEVEPQVAHLLNRPGVPDTVIVLPERGCSRPRARSAQHDVRHLRTGRVR
jgi:hypothetical protein